MIKQRIRREVSSFLFAPWKEEERKIRGSSNYPGRGNYWVFVPNSKFKAVVEQESEKQEEQVILTNWFRQALLRVVEAMRDAVHKARQQPAPSFS